MRKLPLRPKVQVDKQRVIDIGQQLEAQLDALWFTELSQFIEAQEAAIVNGLRAGMQAQGGRTIGEEYERHGGQLWAFAVIKGWFKSQIELGKRYERERLEASKAKA